jgi:RNA polymerase sigma-70 factor (ECF subfamily)
MTILFRRYHRLILSISAKILRDHAEAEDVTQEVFFETYRRAERFDPTKGKVKMWLIQLGYSRSLNRRQYLMLRGLFNQSQKMAASSNLTEPSYIPNGFHGLTIEERTRMMERALERLTQNQREAVELAFFKGLLINEIAEQMHESITNARNHYYRGLRKIRQAMEELSLEAKERARCS